MKMRLTCLLELKDTQHYNNNDNNNNDNNNKAFYIFLKSATKSEKS